MDRQTIQLYDDLATRDWVEAKERRALNRERHARHDTWATFLVLCACLVAILATGCSCKQGADFVTTMVCTVDKDDSQPADFPPNRSYPSDRP